MPFTREQAYAARASMNPAPVFLDCYLTQPLPEDLDTFIGPPEEFFLAPDTQELYTQNLLVPILDDANFGLVLFLNPDSRHLIEMDVEAPVECRTVFHHWQQYLAGLMIRVGEAIEDSQRVRQIAEILEFAYIDRLFDYFERSNSLTGDDWYEARRRFPLDL